jgi:hypothetical protein
MPIKTQENGVSLFSKTLSSNDLSWRRLLEATV